MAEGAQERTEQATPRRRQRAREKGQIPRSREVTSMAGLLGFIIVLNLVGDHFLFNMKEVYIRFLTFQYGMDPFDVSKAAMMWIVIGLLPFFGAIMLLAVASDVMQVGFVTKPLELSLSRLNPLDGIGRLFSNRGLVDFLKSFVKFAVGGVLFYFVIKKDIFALPFLSTQGISQIAANSYDFLMNALIYGFLYLFIIGIVSYAFERWNFEQSIRMSKEEIKEEFKETEGDPKVKSRIKSIQREMSRKRMMAEVPKATVIITNPTHLSIAIKYSDQGMSAPRVVAKGAGHVAMRIREIAREHGIPIVEDKPLARALFSVEVDAFIPPDLYKAVAKILAYIYKLKGRL